MTQRIVAIYGLGLIGGSLGLSLRRAADAPRILGYDVDPRTARTALERGAADALLPDSDRVPEDTDLIAVAVPPRAAVDLVPCLIDSSPPSCTVTDLSSVMLPVLTAVLEKPERRDRFAASHPLSGSERGGIEAARPDLFAGSSVIVGAPPQPGSASERVTALWGSVGAKPMTLAPTLHDALVALTSHVPQVTSTALVRTLRRTGAMTGMLAKGAGPGLRDMSRLAASPSDLWFDILGLNADKITPALELLEREIRGLRHAIEAKDPKLRELLEEARSFQREIVT